MGREEDNEKEIFHDSFDTQEGARKKRGRIGDCGSWYRITQLPNGLTIMLASSFSFSLLLLEPLLR